MPMATNYHQEKKPQQVYTASLDGFIAIDMAQLSLNLYGKDSTPCSLHKSALSRKESLRGVGGGERKASTTSPMEDSATTTTTNFSAVDGARVDVAGEKELGSLPRVSGPEAVGGRGGGSGRYRRLGKRRSPPWQDPKRVLLAFASLSSMGTLLLLYFTLSMGKVMGDDIDAR